MDVAKAAYRTLTQRRSQFPDDLVMNSQPYSDSSDSSDSSDRSGGSAGAARYTHGHGAAVLSAGRSYRPSLWTVLDRHRECWGMYC